MPGNWALGATEGHGPAQPRFPSPATYVQQGPTPTKDPGLTTEVDAQGQGPESGHHPPQAQLLRSLYSQLTGGQHEPGREMARTG